MMKGYDLSSVILAMRTQDASFSCPSRLPMVNTVLTFSPLHDDAHVWIGAAVHFSVSSSELFPSDTNLSQKMLQNFNIALRDPLDLSFPVSPPWRATGSRRHRFLRDALAAA